MHIYLKMVPGTGGWATQNRPRATRSPAPREQVRNSLGRLTRNDEAVSCGALSPNGEILSTVGPPLSARTCACDAAALVEAAQRGILSRAEL